jgi:lipopolysaccharide biosynthesis glycosyltransferase
VVTGADEGYRRPLAVTVASLLLNLSPERRLHLYLLDSGLSPRTRRRLGALVDRLRPDTRLRWLTLDPAEFAHLKVDHRKYLSAAAYARLKIPELLPGLDRVIYLDSDLVVHADLTPLWSADLQGRLVGAVQDSGIPVVGARYGIESFEALGLNAGSPYFNSGVLVIDLAAWRAHDIPKQVFTYLTTYADRLNTCDQEGLNAVLCGRWAPLDFRWNVTTEFFEVENRIPRGPLYDSFHRAVDAAHTGVSASPRIVHYTSPRKPWHGTSRHPFRGEFFRYLRRSGWMRPTAYTAWRTRVAARTLLHGLRNRTRGLRHKVGLTRSLLPARDPEPVS